MEFELSLVQRIQNSLDYVEKHLSEALNIEDIAKVAYMSQASYYTIFSKVFHTTIKDYITRRRLTKSAYELVHTDETILTIALNACYKSYEAYSRKFKKTFGISPSYYRKMNLYLEIFPPVNLINDRVVYKDGGMIMNVTKAMNGEQVDERLKYQLKGYLVDVDIDNFKGINDHYGREVGDQVLLEVPTRIRRILKRQNINSNIVRINGDEFAIVLEDKPVKDIEVLAEEIIQSMVPAFELGEVSLSVSVSLGIAKYDFDGIDTVKQTALDALMDAKKSGKNTFKVY